MIATPTKDQIGQFSDILEKLAEVLDITPAQYALAKERYVAMGRWLSKADSSIAQYEPKVYPQGSFRLGTVIKPLSGVDEYDIDLVCLLLTDCYTHTQKEIKELVGNRIKDNDTYKKMLNDEGRRCWTLNYAESTSFHMDILPAIPDEYLWLTNEGVPLTIAKNSICITDNDTSNKDYENLTNKWPKSNPKGYSEWFKQQMKVIFEQRRKDISVKSERNIEEIELHEIKSPLQRAIQILKRHRDVMFQDDDHKPISIIITTLAAKSYANEDNIYDALINILDSMPLHIETRYVNGKRIKWVANPVNPFENFADKWSESPLKEEKFYLWMKRAKQDISEAIHETGLDKVAQRLKKPFGESTVQKALKSYGDNLLESRKRGNLYMAIGSGMLSSKGSVKVKDHNFYGYSE